MELNYRVKPKSVKKEIEEKYKSLFEPQIEHLHADDIREIFSPYAKDKEKFLQLSDEEIYEFYTSWYKLYAPVTTKNMEFSETEEMEYPETQGMEYLETEGYLEMDCLEIGYPEIELPKMDDNE